MSIHAIFTVLTQEARRWKKPVVSHYTQTPFRVLMSCLLSLRTQDKTTDAASARLFELGDTPRTLRAVPVKAIEKAIYPVCFYRVKAVRIREICEMLLKDFGGIVPDTIEELLLLPGVGRKTANLVVTEGFRKPGICVDVHVHRITNRWGYLATDSPDETEMALRMKLPTEYWIPINELLVMYGQNLCKPISPLCSQCRLRPNCAQTGVQRYR